MVHSPFRLELSKLRLVAHLNFFRILALKGVIL